MLCGDILNQLLDQDGLADAGASEQSYLTALGIGRQQVDYLDAGFQNLHDRTLIFKRRRIAVDDPVFLILKTFPSVNCLSQDVEKAPQVLISYRHADSLSCGNHLHIFMKALAGGQHNAADHIISHMLGGLHDTSSVPVLNLQGIPQVGQNSAFKRNIHNRSHDLNNSACVHNYPFLFCALAPLTTSVISCVIAACLARLYWMDKSRSISFALSVEERIAIILALCSLAYASTRHP